MLLNFDKIIILQQKLKHKTQKHLGNETSAGDKVGGIKLH